MTIIRGPQPRENFQILPNATARDKRLSLRARGLLALMLSYPENWSFNREWLARQTDGEGVTAVRTALRELEKHGYLVRRRVRVDGRFTWVQKVYRTPLEGIAGGSIGGQQADGKSADGNQPSKEVLENENSQEDDLMRVHDVHGDENTFDGTSWRDEDRERFRDLVGDELRSDGSRWREGTWPTDAFYDAFRKIRKHRWPGKRLEAIVDNGSGGLDSWLIDEGLEQVS